MFRRTARDRLDVPPTRSWRRRSRHQAWGGWLLRGVRYQPGPPAPCYLPRQCHIAVALATAASHAVGISGPSVYNHWPNKLDLLVTTLRRGAAALAMDVSTAYRLAADAAGALRMLIGFYLALSHTHHETIGLLITDIGHLPDGERHEIRRAQRDFVSEWVHLLRLDQPRLDPVAAWIRVHAALSVANDIARTPHLRRDPSVPAAVEIICTRLLGLPEAGGEHRAALPR